MAILERQYPVNSIVIMRFMWMVVGSCLLWERIFLKNIIFNRNFTNIARKIFKMCRDSCSSGALWWRQTRKMAASRSSMKLLMKKGSRNNSLNCFYSYHLVHQYHHILGKHNVIFRPNSCSPFEKGGGH